MLVLYPRTSPSLDYFERDPAWEIAHVREGGPRWTVRGQEAPVDGLFVGTPRSRYVGYDLVVAAPRMTSILLAVGSQDEARSLVALHRHAVGEAVTYLETRALVWHRTTLGDRTTYSGRFDRVTSYTHGANRAGEPHLHDHVLFAARPWRIPRTLDAQVLRAHLPAADAIYRATLRDGLTTTIGRVSWRTFGGSEHVLGVDEAFRSRWPGGGDERPPKRTWSPGELQERWRREAAEVAPLLTLEPPPARPWRSHDVGAALAHRHEVRRFDAVAALANGAPMGVRRSTLDEILDRAVPEWRDARGFAGPVLAPARVMHLARELERGLLRDHRWERSRTR